MPIAPSRGARIHYTEHGTRGRGPAVVLIQGLGLSSRFWFDVPELLAHDPHGPRYVLAIDNRGTGRSDKPRRLWTMGTMADDVVAVLDHAGVESAFVVGISMGGMIAQHVALRHPSAGAWPRPARHHRGLLARRAARGDGAPAPALASVRRSAGREEPHAPAPSGVEVGSGQGDLPRLAERDARRPHRAGHVRRASLRGIDPPGHAAAPRHSLSRGRGRRCARRAHPAPQRRRCSRGRSPTPSSRCSPTAATPFSPTTAISSVAWSFAWKNRSKRASRRPARRARTDRSP